jgi:hypothetical protein
LLGPNPRADRGAKRVSLVIRVSYYRVMPNRLFTSGMSSSCQVIP